jgi:hypothetical protein
MPRIEKTRFRTAPPLEFSVAPLPVRVRIWRRLRSLNLDVMLYYGLACVVLLLGILLLAGCASTPFAEIGIGGVRQPLTHATASPVVMQVELGTQWRSGFGFKYNHTSSVDGPPVNSRRDDRWTEYGGMYWRMSFDKAHPK